MSKFKVGDIVFPNEKGAGRVTCYGKDQKFTVTKVDDDGDCFWIKEDCERHFNVNWELAPKEKEKRWLVGSSIFGTLSDAKKFSAGERLILEVEIVAHHIPATTVTWEKKEL